MRLSCVLFLVGLSAVTLLPGCTHDPLSDGAAATRQPLLHPTRILFRLGDDSSASGFASDGQPQRSLLTDRTFLPDGVLLPQSEPPRRLFSSNNWQQVNDVRIYLFRKDANGHFVYYKPLDASGNRQDYLAVDAFRLKFDLHPAMVWWGGLDDTNETHTFIGRLQLPSGSYRFLAVARDDRGVAATDRRLADPNVPAMSWGWSSWVESSTRLDDATLVCDARQTEVAATELFSGQSTETLLVDGSTTQFCQTLNLHRAVAGLLLYVEHIPATIRARLRRTNGSTSLQDVPVKSLAVVHGQTLSDQVLLARREAVAGRLPVTTTATALRATRSAAVSDAPEATSSSGSSSTSLLPTPRYLLLKADIPAQAQVRDGCYVNLSPDNTAHPDALLKGAFVMPQQANTPSAPTSARETYDKSLYLVLLGQNPYLQEEVALKWIPIRLADSAADTTCHPHYYPLLANHFYSIGERHFASDGSSLAAGEDSPIDLRDETTAEITLCLDPTWGEYYGGTLGKPYSGVNLDPAWGEYPGGELQP